MRGWLLAFFLIFSVGHISLSSVSLATTNWTVFSTSLGRSCSLMWGVLAVTFSGCDGIFSSGNILAPAFVPGSIVVSTVPLTPFIDGRYAYEKCSDAGYAKGGCREAFLCGRVALGLQIPAIGFQFIAMCLACHVARRPGKRRAAAYWLSFLSLLDGLFLMPAGCLIWYMMAHPAILDHAAASLAASPWRFRSGLDYSFAVDAAACCLCALAAVLGVPPAVEAYKDGLAEWAETERRRLERIAEVEKGFAGGRSGAQPRPPEKREGAPMRPVGVLNAGPEAGEGAPPKSKSGARLGWADGETPGRPESEAAERKPSKSSLSFREPGAGEEKGGEAREAEAAAPAGPEAKAEPEPEPEPEAPRRTISRGGARVKPAPEPPKLRRWPGR